MGEVIVGEGWQWFRDNLFYKFRECNEQKSVKSWKFTVDNKKKIPDVASRSSRDPGTFFYSEGSFSALQEQRSRPYSL